MQFEDAQAYDFVFQIVTHLNKIQHLDCNCLETLMSTRVYISLELDETDLVVTDLKPSLSSLGVLNGIIMSFTRRYRVAAGFDSQDHLEKFIVIDIEKGQYLDECRSE